MKKLFIIIYLLLPLAAVAQEFHNNSEDLLYVSSYMGHYNGANNMFGHNRRFYPKRRYRNGHLTGFSPSINSFSSTSIPGGYYGYTNNNSFSSKVSRFFAQKFGNNYNYTNPGYNNYYNGNYGPNPQNMTNIFDSDNGFGEYNDDFYGTNSSKSGVSVKIID